MKYKTILASSNLEIPQNSMKKIYENLIKFYIISNKKNFIGPYLANGH